ncbi:MAG TPA: VIT1/CCC1 transporter family protein [Candidatus Binatus sp.]|uniref:VIT1/CCC1 transporter family protein n=1 Tax=Candidatus Binatus sp. TaxID=2811406 RepID=UPI002B48959F|nr:VIT1/CCC1 transporter family protein [Candidatus Binatus sp.]HKN12823.1 VIT1/CCC1 transporter family protein [Candidatus Binatus sp.]
MASVDPAEKRRLFERLSSVREIVFGVQDGVLTTAGVLCGLSGAVSQHSQVALAALASTAAGALSMAAGAYLGARAETEVLHAELKVVRTDAASRPYTVQEGLLDELCKEGLSREAAYRVVKMLSTSPKALASTAEAKMFGLGGAMLGNPALDGVVMGIAFLVGALVPLLPYMLITVPRYDLGGALAATALTLFGVGYFEGWLAHRVDRWRSGMRFLAIAMSAAAAGYMIGLAISPLGATAG